MTEAYGVVSVVMIGLGCFQIYEPLGILVPGIILFSLCVLASANKKG